ncbi:MAG: hypothetical protein A4E72_01985 [Syntrophus sp. PtaU1.Bin208]|nr:MAG: hypothetical protein A4E72_01985 [Syntrophus sp. PtaU1.Bin208]
MRPGIAELSLPVSALRDEKVGRTGKRHGIFAVAGVRAVADDPVIEGNPVSQGKDGVIQGEGFHQKGKLRKVGRQFEYLHGVGQGGQRRGKGAVDKHSQQFPAAFRSADDEPLGKGKFVEGVKTDNVVQMKMAQEEIKGLLRGRGDKAVQLVEAVAGVENKIEGRGTEKDADGVSRLRVIPAVGAQKNNFHCSLPFAFYREICPAVKKCRCFSPLQKGKALIPLDMS